jgi:hypothetical protein
MEVCRDVIACLGARNAQQPLESRTCIPQVEELVASKAGENRDATPFW